MPDFYEIGTIVNTHGIRGEVRVRPSTFDINRFKLIDEVDVRNGKNNIRVKIESVWYHKQFVILKLHGIDSIDDAQKIKGGVMIIPKESALPLDEDEYYLSDLYDIDVLSDDGEDLGKICDIITTGANDVYVVKKDNEKELLIPAIKQCILNVDINEKKMTVHLLDGLR